MTTNDDVIRSVGSSSSSRRHRRLGARDGGKLLLRRIDLDAQTHRARSNARLIATKRSKQLKLP